MADQTVQSQFTALGGRVIEIGLTAKPVTAWGGMAVFAAFAESVGLRKLVERSLHSLVRTSPNALPAADLFLGFLVGVLTGASRMLHLERLRADSALRMMFGITRFVAPTIYARFFQSLRGQFQVHFWETMTAWTLARLPARLHSHSRVERGRVLRLPGGPAEKPRGGEDGSRHVDALELSAPCVAKNPGRR